MIFIVYKRLPGLAGLLLLGLVLMAAPSAALGGDGLRAHWARPAGAGPSFSGEDLLPRACGACHVEKLRDWSASLHSQSMGPGLLFQLDPYTDPQTATSCYFCHAPLQRQSETAPSGGLRPGMPRGADPGGPRKNPAFEPALKAAGVSCAACHARSSSVIGPPSPLLGGLKKGVSAGHKTKKEGFFTESAFCAACHQLRDGFRLNGRLLVNTYAEWKASPAGRAGITCQACHMPGRRHLFRGIHDPAMARRGISIETKKIKRADGPALRLILTNTGAGHFYPTYATPLITIRAFLADSAGRAIKGTEKTAYIGRRLALDLSEELFDTRIAPQGSFVLDYPVSKRRAAEKAAKAVFEARVYPDEFYTRFYEYFLTQEMSAKKKAQLRAAYRKSLESAYLLFRKETPLD